MARWQPRTPKESLQASLERLKARIQAKQQEIQELQTQAKQVEQAISMVLLADHALDQEHRSDHTMDGPGDIWLEGN